MATAALAAYGERTPQLTERTALDGEIDENGKDETSSKTEQNSKTLDNSRHSQLFSFAKGSQPAGPTSSVPGSRRCEKDAVMNMNWGRLIKS